MASHCSGFMVPTATAKAQQMKEQLYNRDAKLTDLFGDLEPKCMLDAIVGTYSKAGSDFLSVIALCHVGSLLLARHVSCVSF